MNMPNQPWNQTPNGRQKLVLNPYGSAIQGSNIPIASYNPQMMDPQMMNPQMMDPQMMNPQNVNPFISCNEGIANGFGPMFFNMRDPNMGKTNHPTKQPPSIHLAVIIGTLAAVGGLAVGIIGLNKFLTTGAAGAIIGVPFALYIIVAICCSDIRGYISNLKRFQDYKATFDKMVIGKGFFVFWIECYHYRTVRTKNGTRREKVVTHTATETFNPRLSIDESGQIEGIQDITRYVFIKYLKRFYFVDAASESKFQAAFNSFVSQNTRDQYQNYTHTFDIQGFEEEVGFTALGAGSHNCIIFYILTILGLGLPYACIIERSISRYEVGILKQLTV